MSPEDRIHIEQAQRLSQQMTVQGVKDAVRSWPDWAQSYLLAEYRRPDGPRWTLVQWLKRHRLHNPTVRVIPN